MEYGTVTIKGQVVIPAALRHKFGIKGGTRVRFDETNGEIRLIPITEELVDKNIGFLGTKGKLLRGLAKEKKRERES